MGEDIAPLHFFQADAGEVHSGPASRDRNIFFAFVGLQPPDAPLPTPRQHFNFLAYSQRSIGQRAGDDRTETGDRESPINRQSWAIQVRAGWSICQTSA
jgi:hypothetical protein